ncbi:MAG TPA: biotin--[acetyl-CoA-carboxylase] ligase [Vicinamibacterales bacterium]|nr:biotin--[acetyl-CoA-carboxylase] ligase [Vicinamibacterales bacterium]
MKSSLFDRIARYDSVASTNDVAASLPEGAVVVADQQTAGRGRRGRSWFSPAGTGLYVSVVLAPSRSSEPRRATTLLTIAAGVAIAEAIEAETRLRVDLKWPNDLYVGRRKLGGILAEAATSGAPVERVVLGYGVNIGRASYPPDVADRATSIETELGVPADRERVLRASLSSLARRYDDLLAARFDGILDAWRARAPNASGARITWMSGAGPIEAVTAGIDADGALLARIGDRVERIVAGEIVWE